jgi:Tfp pilus assembly protein FimT
MRLVTSSAFTLLETLTVIVLLSLVASLGAASLSGTGERARVLLACDLVREADALARTAALGGDTVLIEVVDAGRALRISRSDGQPITTRRLPRGTTVAILDANAQHSLPVLPVGQDGRSPSYQAIITSADQIRRLRFVGLTGWEQEVTGEP